VKIDIPGYEEQLVVDGRIDQNGFPIVLLSRSQNIYASTDLSAYLSSFVTDATLEVTDGVSTVPLQLMTISELPEETRKRVAEMLSVEYDEVLFLPVQVYSTSNTAILGQVGKSYTLNISWKGKSYSGSTTLLPPVALDGLYWEPDAANDQFGLCMARLSDPPGQRNCYKWEPKNFSIQTDGQPKDILFRHSNNPFFGDQFFDGLTFEFDTRYPKGDTTYPDGYRKHYKLGDSIVIKLSRLDNAVYDFFEKKDAQQSNAGSPFATPVNVPSNLSGGALGIWAGYSFTLDTLYCIP
jgi:hypothetical protein